MLIMTFAMSGQSQDAIGKITVKVSSTENHLYVTAYQQYLQQQGFIISDKNNAADLLISLPNDFEKKY